MRLRALKFWLSLLLLMLVENDESLVVERRPQASHSWHWIRSWLAAWMKWWKKYKPIWEPVIFVLTIVMLGLAIKQYRDSSKQLEKVDQVSQRISTQYLNPFPSTLPFIRDFILGTQNGLDLMIDYAGYGQFSSPRVFQTYFEALESLPPKRPIRMLIYDNELAKAAHKEQFAKEQYPTLKEGQNFQTYFTDYHVDYLRNCNFQVFKTNLEYQDFIDMLLSEQVSYQTELAKKNGVQIRYAHGPSQFLVFLWIRDGRDAIFSFKNQGDNNQLRELSFTTSDTTLTEKVFRGIFEDAWTNADPAKQASGKQISPHAIQTRSSCPNGKP